MSGVAEEEESPVRYIQPLTVKDLLRAQEREATTAAGTSRASSRIPARKRPPAVANAKEQPEPYLPVDSLSLPARRLCGDLGERATNAAASLDRRERQMRSLPSSHLRFPPIVNEYSRTLAVPFTGAQDPGSPISRIATNYSGNAAWLQSRVPGVAGRSLRWWTGGEEACLPEMPKRKMDYDTIFADQLIVDGSQLDEEIQEAGLTHGAFYECLFRYNHYVAEGVPDSSIAPYNSLWMANINKLLDLSTFTEALGERHAKDMVQDMHDESRQDYMRAIKRAVVDHIFGDARARERAGVPFVPRPPVPHGAVHFVGVEGTQGGPPEAWREALAASRERMGGALTTCSSSSMKLLELWHREFDVLLLVHLPPPSSSDLVEINAFRSAQGVHCTEVRTLLEGPWLDKAANILHAHSDDEDAHDDSRGFFEAVSALLSTHLRSVVDRSIHAYVNFFQRFAAETFSDPSQVLRLGDNDDRADAFLTVSLTAQFGDIRFTTPLVKIEEALLGIFRNFVVSLRGLQRPDVKLEKFPDLERQHLWEVSLDEGHVKVAEEFIAGVIRLNLRNVERALELYDEYKHLLHEEARVRQLSENLALTREDYMAQVDKLRATEAAIREKCPNEIRLQMISIDCAEINETLCLKATEAVQILLQTVLRNLLLKNEKLVKNFETVVNHMVKKPTSELELVDLEAHVQEFRATGLGILLADFVGIKAWLGFLFECEDRLCWAMLSSIHFQKIYDSARWVHNIDQIVSDREVNLRREREALESKFKEQRNKFLEDLEGFSISVDKFKENSNLRLVDDYLDKIQALRNQFARAHAEAEKMNSKEERLGWKPSSFDQLRHGEQALEPYFWIWTLAYNLEKSHKHWTRGSLFQLNPLKVENEVKSMLREAKRLQELFDELGQPTQSSVASQLSAQLDVMVTSHLGLVHALCNPSLRPRHWEQISRIVGFAIEPDSAWTLSRAVELDVGKHVPNLQVISEAATKEHAIESVLDTMEEEWAPVKLELTPWRQTGTYVFASGGLAVMKDLVDDHFAKTRVMRNSPHVSPWAQRVADWERWLVSTAQILARWMRLQTAWTYLSPVFASKDMLRQMPTEGQLFRTVDDMWRRMMQTASEQQSALQVTRDPSLLDRLSDCCRKLEQVQKGLADYLETKRLAFPRFNFVSDGEMLEILVDMRDQVKVQIHLPRCFAGVHRLKQSKGDIASASSEVKSIGMISEHGEVVAFDSTVDGSDLFEGGAEEWFKEVEHAMVVAVRRAFFEALPQHESLNRVEWIAAFPLQAVIGAGAVLWTLDVIRAIASGTLGQLLKEQEQKLLVLAPLVRSEVPPAPRPTLEALILRRLHQRDVVGQLVDAGVHSEDDFDWFKQLRFTVEEHEATDFSGGDVARDVFVSIAFSRFQMEYEYYGNAPPLVLTSSTQRAYHVLSSASQLNHGGLVSGAVGSGKTAVVRDLAQTIAKMCMVVDCVEGFDTTMLLRFFKGAASGGIWCCFNDLDRVGGEVLSIMAQHVLAIQQALVRQMAHFEMDGATLRIKHCFITACIQPSGGGSQGGRPGLPDSLKALFRPVALNAPDLQVIAYAKLLSFGFEHAEVLSRKLACLFKVCADTILEQRIYHCGLHSVLAVLAATRRLRQTMPGEDEESVVLRAVLDREVPKLLPPDERKFHELVGHVFHDEGKHRAKHGGVRNGIKEHLQSSGLRKVEYLENKTLQVFEMTSFHCGLLTVGGPFGGKTTSISALAAVLANPSECGAECSAVKLVTLNPNALTAVELFGSFSGSAWTDGILTSLLRAFTQEPSPTSLWLHLDGEVAANWAEALCPLLDDRRRLAVGNGDVVAVPGELHVLLEAQDAAGMSPGILARCGVVHFSPEELGYMHLVEAWFESKCPKSLGKEEREDLMGILDCLLKPLMRLMSKRLLLELHSREHYLVQNVLAVLTVLLPASKDQEKDRRGNAVLNHNNLHAALISACVWGLGSLAADHATRKEFDQELRHLLPECTSHGVAGTVAESAPPEEGLCFDYIWDEKNSEWCSWLVLAAVADKPPHSAEVSRSHFYVQTLESAPCIHFALMSCAVLKPFAFCGPCGVGKTTYLREVRLHLDPARCRSINFSLSPLTTSLDIQDAIDELGERRQRDRYGPPDGLTCAIVIDDMHLPAVSGQALPQPLDLLRQFCSYGGWYDRADPSHPFKHMVDSFLLAAVGAPKGDEHVSTRMLRHMHLLGALPLESDRLTNLFSDILCTPMIGEHCVEAVEALAPKLAAAIVEVHDKLSVSLRPTPSTPHYGCSLHEAFRILRGMLRFHSEDAAAGVVVRLWAHESIRTYVDRRTCEVDQNQVLSLLRSVAGPGGTLSLGGAGPPLSLSATKPLFASGKLAGNEDGLYDEVVSVVDYQDALEELLKRMNKESQQPQEFMLFAAAAQHVARIARVLETPHGCALLFGTAQSGRRSVTRMAAFVSLVKVVEFGADQEYSWQAWRELVKEFLRMCGSDEKSVFVFSESQVKDEAALADMHSLITSGSMPTWWVDDERHEVMEILQEVTGQAFSLWEPSVTSKTESMATTLSGGMDLAISPATDWISMHSKFAERCRERLHVVLCPSRDGPSLRTMLRRYPAFLRSCDVDWFGELPAQALEDIAERSFPEVELEDERGCIQMCQFMHTSSRSQGRRLHLELSRTYHTTLSCYMELIRTFTCMLAAQKESASATRHKYLSGLQGLQSVQSSLDSLRQVLNDSDTSIASKREELDRISEQVEADKVVAERAVKAELAMHGQVNAKRQTIAAMKKEVSHEVGQVSNAVNDVLSTLDPETGCDVSEIRNMRNPINSTKKVMEMVCILKGQKVMKIRADSSDPGAGTMTPEQWATTQKMLGEVGFLLSLPRLDRDKISGDALKKITRLIADDDCEPSKVQRISKVVGNILQWVKALVKYSEVQQAMAPKRWAIADEEKQAEELTARLSDAQRERTLAAATLAKRQEVLSKQQAELESLITKQEWVAQNLQRGIELVAALEAEQEAWSKQVVELDTSLVNACGNTLLAAGFVTHLGTFPAAPREAMFREWADKLASGYHIAFDGDFSLPRLFTGQLDVHHWLKCGLPNNAHSLANAAIISLAYRWPLCIDPQGQANAWLKAIEGEHDLLVVSTAKHEYWKELDVSKQQGRPMLLEDFDGDLRPVVRHILDLRMHLSAGPALGKQTAEGSESPHSQARFFMTTRRTNIELAAEVCSRTTLVDFTITPEGLTERLLTVLLQSLAPEMTKLHAKAALEVACHDADLLSFEQDLLSALGGAAAPTLEDGACLNGLCATKASSRRATELRAQAEARRAPKSKTEEKLLTTRRAVAARSSTFLLSILKLERILPVYRFSMDFLEMALLEGFRGHAGAHEPVDGIARRVCQALYLALCAATYSKHHLLLSCLLAGDVALTQDDAQHPCRIEPAEFEFLLSSGRLFASAHSSTDLVGELSTLPVFIGLPASLHADAEAWQRWQESTDPLRADFPGAFAQLTLFQKALLVRCLCPDRAMGALREWIGAALGQETLAQTPTLDLKGAYARSGPSTSIMFVLAPGADPLSPLLQFSDHMQQELCTLSIGTPSMCSRAAIVVMEAARRGRWVYLPNCHLELAWLSRLLLALEPHAPKHEEFRLWLSAIPRERFPIRILECSVKIVCEPPVGMKASILSALASEPLCDEMFFGGCPVRDQEWKRALLDLLVCHGVVQGRRSYGALGWSAPYEFADTDLLLTAQQLQVYLTDAPLEAPLKALQYLTLEVNYGGRLREPEDERLLRVLVTDLCGGASGSSRETWEGCRPTCDRAVFVGEDAFQGLTAFAAALPQDASPVMQGLHPSAVPVEPSNSLAGVLGALRLCFRVPASSSASDAPSVGFWPSAAAAAEAALARLPKASSLEAARNHRPLAVQGHGGLYSVQQQELRHYRALLASIADGLVSVLEAASGAAAVSREVEVVAESLVAQQVPAAWLACSYPSCKSLSGYIEDFVLRADAVQRWNAEGAPALFWISGLFSIPGFLVGVLQQSACVGETPLEDLRLEIRALGEVPERAAEEGVYARGLFLEGARWDFAANTLAECTSSGPSAGLRGPCPPIWLVARAAADGAGLAPPAAEGLCYECPVYVLPQRHARMSSRSNLVFRMLLPCAEEGPNHWVCRGVAALSQLDD
mmetsp:Transcript_1989/g.7603  ORF Transcript_1989/g.7603 Transcript_1989/m.7603 type:complete len:4147 (+) Transcript_1989:89-12529(+)